nr:phage tail protein [uncultured Pseudodesulfovibrio sp.]
MMRTVHLHGHLGDRYGVIHRLDVSTPAEAVRALNVILGRGFGADLRKGEWHVVGGVDFDTGTDYGSGAMLDFGLGSRDLHIAPAVSGSKRGLFQVVLGVAIMAVAWYAAPAVVGAMGPTMGMATEIGLGLTYGNMFAAGAMMSLGGAASMLSSTPSLTSGYEAREKPDERRSFLFTGATNTTEQGGAIPVVLGTGYRVGWTLISSGITVEQLDLNDQVIGSSEYTGDTGAGITGSGGGGGGGGSVRVPVEAPNDLRSRSTIRAEGVIAEGEIGGLKDGEKSIFFGDTPLMAEDGTYNFKGVRWWLRTGSPDQDPIPGFSAVENEYEIKAQVTHATPITRTVTNAQADAVRVRINIPRLYRQEDNGDMNPSQIELAVDIRPQGGDYVERVRDVVDGKCMAAYERAYRIELIGTGPWDVRVRRVTEDNEDNSRITDEFSWAALTEIVDLKFTHPHTAKFAVAIDAEEFGNALEPVSLEIVGVKVEVPSNYDPETRIYAGAWDGTFKTANTDNPAWNMREVLVNDRWGCGLTDVDKWGLYEISGYSDELVDDGYGGQEPRFTLNHVMQTREDVHHVVTALTSTFRGMAYWSTGSIFFAQDRPMEPTHPPLVRANVKGGEFAYEPSGLDERHTVAMVTWNNPLDGYKPDLEIYEDVDAIAKYGWHPTDKVAIGCTSRGQAHRLAKWLVYTEQEQTDAVSCVTGFDHADAVPGSIVPVVDPVIMGVEYGGRIKAAAASEITLDRHVEIRPDTGYVLTLTMPDNSSLDVRVINSAGESDTMMLEAPLPQLPLIGSVWAMTASDLAPRLFRVTSLKEEDIHEFSITAIEYDSNKFDAVEKGIKFDPVPDSLIPTGPVAKPVEPVLDEFLYTQGEGMAPGVLVSWSHPSNDPRVVLYEAQVKRPNDTWDLVGTVAGNSIPIKDTPAGSYSFRVRSLSRGGAQSVWVTLENRNLQGLNQNPNDVQDLVMVQRNGQGVIAWSEVRDWRAIRYEIRKGQAWNTAQRIGSTAELSYPVGANGTYMVKAKTGDAYSDNPALVVVDGAGRLTSNVLAMFDEAAQGWPGTKTGTTVDPSGNLTLSDPAAPGSYFIPEAHRVTLTAPALCNVMIDYTLFGAGVEEDMYAVEDFYAISDLYGGWGEFVSAQPQIRLYKDGTWSDWIRFVPGSYHAENFDFCIGLSSDRADVLPVLDEFSFIVDVPDRAEKRDNLAVPVDGLTVSFSHVFNAIPAVVCQVVNGQSGDDVELTSITAAGFAVRIKDKTETYVARSINFIAQGY